MKKPNNKFGRRSNEVLETLHQDLRQIMNLAIRRSYVDFGLHEGARTIEKQQEYFDTGKSKINPKSYATESLLCEKAKHVTTPYMSKYYRSRAVDFHIAEKHKGKSLAWDEKHLTYVIGVIQSCALELYEAGEIDHIVRSGADWDSDGVLLLDQKFDDGPHVELVKMS